MLGLQSVWSNDIICKLPFDVQINRERRCPASLSAMLEAVIMRRMAQLWVTRTRLPGLWDDPNQRKSLLILHTKRLKTADGCLGAATRFFAGALPSAHNHSLFSLPTGPL